MTSKLGLKHIQAIAPYVGGRPISEVAREYGFCLLYTSDAADE